jgi:hypothetical protein
MASLSPRIFSSHEPGHVRADQLDELTEEVYVSNMTEDAPGFFSKQSPAIDQPFG